MRIEKRTTRGGTDSKKQRVHIAADAIRSGFSAHDRRILLLQGGGALGAYHAGVYEGLAEGGFAPDWVVGISVGAINAALIAGNAPENRLDRLREFWDLVSAQAPVILPAGMDFARSTMNQMAAASAMLFGIRGFFAPRLLAPQFAPAGTIGALSYYDTEPLRATLEKLVDFDRINAGDVRLSLGTANVRTGESVYFDTTTHTITASHVMASGALPPGFPPVEIDGEFYIDGGVMTNTPLAYAGKDFRMSALVVQVDLFSGMGSVPKTLNEVQERVKDIQFQSKMRLSVDEMRGIEALRSMVANLIERLPARLRSDPQVKKLEEISHRGRLSLIHLVNRHDTGSLDFKDYEFSRATVQDLWEGGYRDVVRVLKTPDSCVVSDIGNGVRIYDLPS